MYSKQWNLSKEIFEKFVERNKMENDPRAFEIRHG